MHTVRTALSDAKHRGLVVVSGLAGRHHAATIETIARIHDGGIGHPLRGVCTADLGLAWNRPMRSPWSAEELRHRNWVADPKLSGGLLVESHLDALDRSLWAMGDPCPVAASPAVSPGGFGVRYRFADGSELHAAITRSIGGTGQRDEWVQGPRGVADLVRHTLTGRQAWRSTASSPNPWQVCMGGFVDAVISGGRGDGGDRLLQSNLVALLGQTAIETGREVPWAEVANPSGVATGII
jgi:predicted dehydrogenase